MTFPPDEISELREDVQAMTLPSEMDPILDRLRRLRQRDPESGHSIDDELRERVLTLIAGGSRYSRQLARTAMETSGWKSCSRYYA
jgi:MoxR-like ATPase